jgi:protoporphyrin/coproporphyrin ferrochelatase
MTEQNNPVGVLLLGFGGPDTPEAIEPFVKNIFGGRVPSPAIIEKVKGRYQLIGGSSPFPRITGLQAKALEGFLKVDGNYKVEVGMLNWHPYIDEAINNLAKAGVKEIIAISLAPFYATVSTKAYYDAVVKAVADLGYDIQVKYADSWYNNPLFIKAVAEKLVTSLNQLPEEALQNIQVIFSAHSLPEAHIEGGDPYVEQFKEASYSVAAAAGNDFEWHLAYQSKGGGQGKWLGPEVEEVMDNLKEAGHNNFLLVPIGFVSDHIETLYDIDIAIKGHAEKLGVNFYRTASLNTSDLFIEALASIVKSK